MAASTTRRAVRDLRLQAPVNFIDDWRHEALVRL